MRPNYTPTEQEREQERKMARVRERERENKTEKVASAPLSRQHRESSNGPDRMIGCRNAMYKLMTTHIIGLNPALHMINMHCFLK